MAKTKNVDETAPDPSTMRVDTLDQYTERGWLYYAQKDYDKAIADFHHVLDQQPDHLDTWYGLGLTLKAAGSYNEATDAFSHVLGMLSDLEDKQRAHVLDRLAKGHINQMKTGDWDLEKEVWKRA